MLVNNLLKVITRRRSGAVAMVSEPVKVLTADSEANAPTTRPPLKSVIFNWSSMYINRLCFVGKHPTRRQWRLGLSRHWVYGNIYLHSAPYPWCQICYIVYKCSLVISINAGHHRQSSFSFSAWSVTCENIFLDQISPQIGSFDESQAIADPLGLSEIIHTKFDTAGLSGLELFYIWRINKCMISFNLLCLCAFSSVLIVFDKFL